MSTFGFRLICGLYIFFNLLFFIYYAFGNPLLGDFKEKYGTVSIDNLVLGLLAIISSLWLLLTFCKYVSKIPIKAKIKLKSSFMLDSIFLAITLFYFLCVAVFSVGVSGVDESQLKVSKAILYGYALLQPGFLVLIYIYCFYHVKSKMYNITLPIFVLTSILSGATANLIFIFLLWASYTAHKKRVLLLLFLGILLSPFIRFIKYVLLAYNRNLSSGEGSELAEAFATYKTDDMSFLDTYMFFLKGAFSRFEMISSNSYIIENNHIISSFANSVGFIYPQKLYFIYKFIEENYFLYSEKAQYSLQYIFAYFLSGSTDWNANIGFLGFAIIGGPSSMIVYLLVAILIMLTVTMSKTLYGDGAISQLTSIYVVIVLWHGWVIAYIYYAHALILFALIVLFSGRFKSYKYN